MLAVKGVFWNDQEHRLRTGWRLILTYLMVLLVSLPIGVVGMFLPTAEASGASGNGPLIVIIQVLFMAGVIAAAWYAGRLLDRRRFADFGLHFNVRWWQDLGFGLLLGALLMTGIFLVELALGWVTITGTFTTPQANQPFGLAIFWPILLYITVGVNEELLFRGYLLKNLAEGLNLPQLSPRIAISLAWVLSSMLFGLLHAGNPNATLISTLNITLAGIWLAIGYLLTGELAIPIGAHITWNFFQGNVYSFPVSGTTAPLASFMTVEQGGPAFWTGGNFGPEAGLLANIALLLGTLLILGWVRLRTGQLRLQTALAEFHQPPQLAHSGSAGDGHH